MPKKILVSQQAYDIYQTVILMAVAEPEGKVFSGTLKSLLGRSHVTLWGRELSKQGAVRMLKKGRWLFPADVELEIKSSKRGSKRPKPVAEHPLPAKPIVRSRKDIIIVIPKMALEEDQQLRNILIDALFINEHNHLRSSIQLTAISLALRAAATDAEFIEHDRKMSEIVFKLGQDSGQRKQANRPYPNSGRECFVIRGRFKFKRHSLLVIFCYN